MQDDIGKIFPFAFCSSRERYEYPCFIFLALAAAVEVVAF